MNLSAIYEFEGPPRWPEPASAFLELLASRGIFTSWWKHQSDEENESPTESLPELDADTQIAELIARIKKAIDDNPDDPDLRLRLLGTLILPGRTRMIQKLLDDGDRLIDSGDTEKALRTYEELDDWCYEAPTYTEVARLIMRRIIPELGHDAFMSEAEFSDFSPYRSLADEDRLHKRPRLPQKAVERLANLAFQCYGRAYAWYSDAANDDNMDHNDLDELCLRACLALDGLRAVFSLSQEFDTLELACWVYKAWDRAIYSAMAGKFIVYRGYSGEVDFARRFEEAMGYISGMRTKNPVDRSTARETLAALLGPTWPQLTKLPREYLVTAEILYEHLDTSLDCSPIVNEYSKAVEAALHTSLGVRGDEDESSFAAVLKAAVDRGRKYPVKSLARVSLSTFKDSVRFLVGDRNRRALFSAWVHGIVPEASPSWVDEFGAQLDKIVPARTKADHAVGPGISWKVSREEAERVRELCLGNSGLVHKLARLTPRGGERG